MPFSVRFWLLSDRLIIENAAFSGNGPHRTEDRPRFQDRAPKVLERSSDQRTAIWKAVSESCAVSAQHAMQAMRVANAVRDGFVRSPGFRSGDLNLSTKSPRLRGTSL